MKCPSCNLELGENAKFCPICGATVIKPAPVEITPEPAEIPVEQPVFENPALKARIGYIPDDIFFFPSASLEDMRRFYKGIYPKFDDELFERLYEVFQLPRKIRKKAMPPSKAPVISRLAPALLSLEARLSQVQTRESIRRWLFHSMRSAMLLRFVLKRTNARVMA